MSKLAILRTAQLVGDPFFGTLIRGAGGLIKKGIGRIIGRGTSTLPQITGAATGVARRIPRGVKVAAGAAAAGGLAGVLAGGTAPGVGVRRRGRGITSRELRGFRKVTNLLRKVGMVPKGLRRGKKVC